MQSRAEREMTPGLRGGDDNACGVSSENLINSTTLNWKDYIVLYFQKHV